MAAQLVHEFFIRRTRPEEMPDRLLETDDRMRCILAAPTTGPSGRGCQPRCSGS